MKYILILLLLLNSTVFAQRATIRRNIERNVEKKVGGEHRDRGRKEIQKVTYENDKRYEDPYNKVQATFAFETTEFNKKGAVKKTLKDRVILGKTGECMVSAEGDKGETWFIYNYADKANYLVNVKDRTAMKMPLINMKKMVDKMAEKEAEKMKDDSTSEWKATDERKDINGYSCRKYTHSKRSEPGKVDFEVWATPDIQLDLQDNYILGARLSSYKMSSSPQNKDMPNGFIVRMVMYDKNGKPENQRDLVLFERSADEKYFDMTQFKINDVLSGL